MADETIKIGIGPDGGAPYVDVNWLRAADKKNMPFFEHVKKDWTVLFPPPEKAVKRYG